MAHASDLIATDIEAYLAEHEQKDLLRFLTCGSVDDGKSTLIGRLLHDSNMIYQDHLAALESDSVTSGTTGDEVDLALLMDGLKAEREQGITIDVAYRYFSTARRKFIIADTPGHEQYTRNMVTGASNCQLAILLIDARHGVQAQTKRHSYIVSLLGIRHVVVAVNKMDLVDWSQERFDEIAADYHAFADGLGVVDPYLLPMSALAGDNVVEPSANMPWFDGVPLMEHLETVDVEAGVDLARFRFPVQLVTRPDLDFRGFAGTVAAGTVAPGDTVTALPSGVSSTVERIVTFDGDLDLAGPGRAVTLTLADEIDISRGDILVGDVEQRQRRSHDQNDPPLRSHDLDAMVVWMSDDECLPGRQYLLQSVNGLSNASVRTIRHRVDINTLDHEDADSLGLNDIARCELVADRELVFDPYARNRTTGSFILIDRLSNATVGAGMIVGRSSAWDASPEATVTASASQVTPEERAARLGQQPATVLLTGLTGAGKSTLSAALERRLFDRGRTVVRLDGENVRLGISRDLGFSAPDRSENLRRVAEVARTLNDQGLLVIAGLVAPEAAVRDRARDVVGDERFIEVFLDTPIEVCRERDEKGMYAAADAGEIERFPGVSAAYEAPDHPDLRLDTSRQSVEESVEAVLALLTERGILSARS
ncbi:MAG: sulfate adenylyltransferase subunit CysN [Actinobacteria bacterium]|nr:sulfate adenylyltransferase subunit CysN [Actinomycetota bacterium]